jgi:hypothetical protein
MSFATLWKWPARLVQRGMVFTWLGAASCAASEGPLELSPETFVWDQTLAHSLNTMITWVVIVDDRDDPTASRVRDRVKAAFSSYMQDPFANETNHGLKKDSWFPMDLRMVVVRPSFRGEQLWLGPDDDPGLRWVTTDASEAGARAFSASFDRAVDGALAAAGAPYKVLDAYRRVALLVTGCTVPENAREARLAESAGAGGPSLRFLVASAADDESPLPPNAYAETAFACSQLRLAEMRMHAPGVPAGNVAPCWGSVTPAWRLAEFAKPGFFPAIDSGCESSTWSSWFRSGWVSAYRPRC